MLLGLCVFMCVGQALAVRAEPREQEEVFAARNWGRNALLALEQGDYAKADALFSRAIQAHAAPTLYQKRGVVRRALGKLLAAAADFRAALEFPIAADEHPKYNQARRDAEAELQSLTPLIPRLALRANGDLVRVTVNGTRWPVKELSQPRALDPGAYTIEATTPAGTSRTYHVTLASRDTRELTLEGSPLTKLVRGGSDARSSAGEASNHAKSYTATYVLLAVTAALTAGAIASGVVAANRSAAFDAKNRPDVSMGEKQHLRKVASTWAWLNTALCVGAVTAAGVTTYAYLSATSSSPSEGARTGLDVQLIAAGTF
jgi:tetratricopeptide (TPR) repeat protein